MSVFGVDGSLGFQCLGLHRLRITVIWFALSNVRGAASVSV